MIKDDSSSDTGNDFGPNLQRCSETYRCAINEKLFQSTRSHAKEKIQTDTTCIAVNSSFKIPFFCLPFSELPRMNHSSQIDGEHGNVQFCLVMLLSSSPILCSTVIHNIHRRFQQLKILCCVVVATGWLEVLISN